MTRCGKCESGFFESVEIEPKGSTYKHIAVQCSMCKTPFGVTDYFNLGVLMQKQQKEIADLKTATHRLHQDVQQILQALRR